MIFRRLVTFKFLYLNWDSTPGIIKVSVTGLQAQVTITTSGKTAVVYCFKVKLFSSSPQGVQKKFCDQ